MPASAWDALKSHEFILAASLFGILAGNEGKIQPRLKGKGKVRVSSFLA
jgi:hypothetical protein